MKTLFLIPARGDSKGFPGKNLAMLAGIPLVGRATRVARQAAARLDGECRVLCSTDSPAIARAARAWGAEVPFMRPTALATDEATSLDVARHALEVLGQEFESVILLQATSPLTEPEDVLGALELHHRTGRHPVVSVYQAEHPVEWHFRMDDNQRLVPMATGDKGHRRQQTRPAYRPNGAVYVATPAQIQAEGFWTTETRGFVMPAERSVDVDRPQDLIVARAILDARQVPCIEIAGRKIGPGQPCFIIADAGVNHNGSLELALKLVDAAAAAGADAVKFQTFRAEKVMSRTAPLADYQRANTGGAETQFEMAKRLELSPAQHKRIREYCLQQDILYLSSAFDEGSVDALVEVGVPALKIGSGELTNHRLLAYIARQGLPVLLSTGMSSMEEVDEALAVLRANNARSVALFHCVSNYPAAPSDCNLAAIDAMRNLFSVPVGWSDHTLGVHVTVAAVARGATLIEKHLTLDKKLPGPDHVASLDPDELRTLVKAVRDTERCIGTGVKIRQCSEENTAAVARKSIHAARPLPAGHRIVLRDLVLLRPGTGIPGNQLEKVVGRVTRRDVQAGVALSEADLC